jgi:hypothetical protein
MGSPEEHTESRGQYENAPLQRVPLSAVPLLNDFVHEIFYSAPEAASVKEKDHSKEDEIEIRYIPRRALRPDELALAYDVLEISQCYVDVQDDIHEEHDITVRFRRSRHHDSSNGEVQQHKEMLRMAYKQGSGEHRIEFQTKFRSTDERAPVFEDAWQQRTTRTITKTRYYFKHTLPNGNQCKIHYDLHHDCEDSAWNGFVRIEIEFDSPDDMHYAQEHPDSIPDYIGQPTRKYSGSSMTRGGPDVQAQKLIREFSTSAHN